MGRRYRIHFFICVRSVRCQFWFMVDWLVHVLLAQKGQGSYQHVVQCSKQYHMKVLLNISIIIYECSQTLTQKGSYTALNIRSKCMLFKYGKCTRDFLGRFYFILVEFSILGGGVFLIVCLFRNLPSHIPRTLVE